MSKRNIVLKVDFFTDTAKVVPVNVSGVKDDLTAAQIKAFTDVAIASNAIYTKDGSKVVSVKSQTTVDQSAQEFDLA